MRMRCLPAAFIGADLALAEEAEADAETFFLAGIKDRGQGLEDRNQEECGDEKIFKNPRFGLGWVAFPDEWASGLDPRCPAPEILLDLRGEGGPKNRTSHFVRGSFSGDFCGRQIYRYWTQ